MWATTKLQRLGTARHGLPRGGSPALGRRAAAWGLRSRSRGCRASGEDGSQQPVATSEGSQAPRPLEGQPQPAGDQGPQPEQAPQQPGEEEKEAGPRLQLPREVVQQLRNSVFGFDTFYVTSQENYQASGVLFKGNLRGDPAVAYAKMAARLKEQLGDGYRLYLLEDPADSKPVAVVLPLSAVQPPAPPYNEALLGTLFGTATVLATLNINGAELFNFVLLTFGFDPAKLAEATPGTLAFLAILAAHEVGHIMAAKQRGVELAPPILIPAGLGLLGSFGAITRIKSIVPDRTTFGEVAVAGPLAGSALSFAIMLVGLALTAGGQGGVELDVDSFRESLVAGLAGQLAFGERLFQAESLDANPLFVAGFAGLIINAINMIPIGELDGGRAFLALFGRRAARAFSAISFLLMGLFAFSNGLALYWFLLALTLQRNPPPPCEDEVSEMRAGQGRTLALAALVLPLLVLLPYPLGGGGGEDAALAGFF